MKIVIIDNYDSFTYNLSHLVKELGAEVTVLRNDQFSLDEIESYSKFAHMPVRSLFWVCALVIRPLARYLEENWRISATSFMV